MSIFSTVLVIRQSESWQRRQSAAWDPPVNMRVNKDTRTPHGSGFGVRIRFARAGHEHRDIVSANGG